MLDALTAWVYGKYAVALNGLGNELQFKQLRELPCRKIILATDSDEAGMKARKRIRANVKNKIITEYILPRGKKDLNELSRKEFDNLEEVF
jgi:DNA primase